LQLRLVFRGDYEMIDLKKVNLDDLSFFRFKELNGQYLLTNEIGEYIFLEAGDFRKLTQGRLNKAGPVYRELKTRSFISKEINRQELVERFRQRNKFLWQGPSLHIVVVTLRCDHRCIYCQTSSVLPDRKGFDMTEEVAKKTVDVIFGSPSQAITIEFQGGEPLMNWKVVRFICAYASEKNKSHGKDLRLTLVTNLSLMDEKKLNFLLDNNVTICTSLDGPRHIHDKNRKLHKSSRSSYNKVTSQIRKIMKKYKNPKAVGALTTVSRTSLSYPKQIIDEYNKWGFSAIHLRPLSNLGFSEKARTKIGYSAGEFVEFYRKCLDYLIGLNLEGRSQMVETTARILLSKILLGQTPNYLDIRSPCGAGIGQLAYNYDGSVYICDEARMLRDEIFSLGNVGVNSYEDIISHSGVSSTCISSVLEGLYCDYCAYKPYCGVCPVCNYKETSSLYTQMGDNEKCKINEGTMDYLFSRLQDEKVRKVFLDWVLK